MNLSWYNSFLWLHCELGKDVVLCATCVSLKKKGNLRLGSKNRMSFFLLDVQTVRRHWETLENCHLEAASVSVIQEAHQDIEEMLCNTLSQGKS